MTDAGTADELRELFDYDRWANRRILSAVSRLSHGEFTRNLGSSHPSVRATLVHILSAEWMWLERWRGRSPSAFPDWDVATFDDLERRWDEVEEEVRAFLDGLDEADIRRTLTYRNTSGEEFTSPLWQLLRHVANHSTYHRGQVTTMLRQLGAEPVATDLVLYHRTRDDAGDDG